MEWHNLDAHSLALIDRNIRQSSLAPAELSPAQYEVARRVVYTSGNYDLISWIRFSPQALIAGSQALLAKQAIVVDSAMIKTGIMPSLREGFASPVYDAATEWSNRPQSKAPVREATLEQISDDNWQVLSAAHPDGIFVIGASLTALKMLIQAIESERIHPALVIATPTEFQTEHSLKAQLKAIAPEFITIEGCKGGITAATAIFVAITELTWHAYPQALA